MMHIQDVQRRVGHLFFDAGRELLSGDRDIRGTYLILVLSGKGS